MIAREKINYPLRPRDNTVNNYNLQQPIPKALKNYGMESCLITHLLIDIGRCFVSANETTLHPNNNL